MKTANKKRNGMCSTAVHFNNYELDMFVDNELLKAFNQEPLTKGDIKRSLQREVNIARDELEEKKDSLRYIKAKRNRISDKEKALKEELTKEISLLKDVYEEKREKNKSKNIVAPESYFWVANVIQKHGNVLLPKELLKKYGLSKAIATLSKLTGYTIKYKVVNPNNMEGNEEYHAFQDSVNQKLKRNYDVILEASDFGLIPARKKTVQLKTVKSEFNPKMAMMDNGQLSFEL